MVAVSLQGGAPAAATSPLAKAVHDQQSADVLPFVKAGKVRALAVTARSARRAADLPRQGSGFPITGPTVVRVVRAGKGAERNRRAGGEEVAKILKDPELRSDAGAGRGARRQLAEEFGRSCAPRWTSGARSRGKINCESTEPGYGQGRPTVRATGGVGRVTAPRILFLDETRSSACCGWCSATPSTIHGSAITSPREGDPSRLREVGEGIAPQRWRRYRAGERRKIRRRHGHFVPAAAK